MNVDCNLFMQLPSPAPPITPYFLNDRARLGEKYGTIKLIYSGRCLVFARCFDGEYFTLLAVCSGRRSRSKGASDQRLSCIISGLKGDRSGSNTSVHIYVYCLDKLQSP